MNGLFFAERAGGVDVSGGGPNSPDVSSGERAGAGAVLASVAAAFAVGIGPDDVGGRSSGPLRPQPPSATSSVAATRNASFAAAEPCLTVT